MNLKTKAPKNLSEDIIEKNSMVYRLSNKNAKLTAWHRAVNDAVYCLARENPDLLYNRAELKREARKTYVFKKASVSGSQSVDVQSQKNPKRAEISSSERNERISSLICLFR